MLRLREGAVDPAVLDFSPAEGEYRQLFDVLVERERELLATLGFIFHVEHPQRFLLFFIKVLQVSEQVAQASWDLMLDSLRLAIHCYMPGNVVATACLYLAFRKTCTPMPKSQPPWWGTGFCYQVFNLQFPQCCQFLKAR